MSELHLDYQRNSPTPWPGVILLALALLVLVWCGAYYLRLSDQASNLESKSERIRDKAMQHGSAERADEHGAAELAQEVTNANEVLHRLSVPWQALFRAIETSGGGKVTLLALEPDIEKRQMKISGETKNYALLMNYLTQLQGHPIFASVYLKNHHVQQQDADKPLRFSLLATWQENP